MAVLARKLVAAVAHDLRAPLASLKASSSVLADADLSIGADAPATLATPRSTRRPTGSLTSCRTCWT